VADTERTLLQKLWSITLLLGMRRKKNCNVAILFAWVILQKKWFALPGCMIKVSISGCRQQAAETTPIETNRALFNMHKEQIRCKHLFALPNCFSVQSRAAFIQ